MPDVTHPPKEAVREYMQQRTHATTPPADLEEIRRQLGWWLLPHNGPAPEPGA